MPIIAQGQFSIVDYNDAIQITSFLRTNSAKTVVYDPTAVNKYSPDWTLTPYCELCPVITMARRDGTGTDDITALIDATTVKWSKVVAGVTTQLTWNANGSKSTVLSTSLNDTNITFCEYGATISTLTPFGIRIKENKMTASIPAIDYIFEAKYRDTSTQLWIDIKATLSYSLVQNGSNIAMARAYALVSDTFYNATDTSTLNIGADLLRGINPDTTVSYQWYEADGSVFAPTVTTQAVTTAMTTVTIANITGMAIGGKFTIGAETKTITNIVAGTFPAGTITLNAVFASAYVITTAVTHPDYVASAGIGWSKLVSTALLHTGVVGVTGTGSCLATIYALDVAGSNTYKVVMKDDESLAYYSDTITLFDISDPLQVEIFSPTGNVIKNGQGSCVMSATVKRNGVIVTTKSDGTPFVIKFRKILKDGTADGTFGTAGYMTTVSTTFASVVYPYAITVTALSIDDKATFVCEVS